MPRHALALCLCLPLAADGLGDLRARLDTFKGGEPVKARLELQSWTRGGDGKKSEESTAQAEFGLEDGPQGLAVRALAATSARARQERAGGPKDRKPTWDLLKGFGLQEAEELLDGAAALRMRIREVTVLEDRADASQGRPGRYLKLQLKPESGAAKGAKLDANGVLQVWTDLEGTPLASEEGNQREVGFLMLKAKEHDVLQCRYQKVGGRLLVVSRTDTTDASAMGMQVQSKKVFALRVE